MSIRWDKRNKRWRFEFDRYIEGERKRTSKLLPKGWSRAQADAFDQKETGRLYLIGTGVTKEEPLIDEAVIHYLRDKKQLKSYRSAVEHLGSIAWAYAGRPISDLHEVARDVCSRMEVAPATTRNRLALLKAACRWAWKKHGLTDSDPTGRMQLPQVRNERKVYASRGDMLRICRACTNWDAQVAIRVAFYTGMRLGELSRVRVDGGLLVLDESKNGEGRAIPCHPKIAHLRASLPVAGRKHTIQVAFIRARNRAGLPHIRFHDLRHSAASEMINAGVPLFDVGAVLGHRDPRSTQRYSHLTAGRLADAIGTIGRKSPHTGGEKGIRTPEPT
jgi:integrase